MSYKGTVKWFNAQKGFGFITPDDQSRSTGDQNGRDHFVHISALERSGLTTLAEGQKVEYELREQRGRMAAANIRVAA